MYMLRIYEFRDLFIIKSGKRLFLRNRIFNFIRDYYLFNMFYKKIMQHGDSLVVVLPAQWCRSFEIKKGDYIKMVINANQNIVIQKVDNKLIRKDGQFTFIYEK